MGQLFNTRRTPLWRLILGIPRPGQKEQENFVKKFAPGVPAPKEEVTPPIMIAIPTCSIFGYAGPSGGSIDSNSTAV